MRQPNCQLGWYVPNQIAALTHFHPDVTAEDFQALFKPDRNSPACQQRVSCHHRQSGCPNVSSSQSRPDETDGAGTWTIHSFDGLWWSSPSIWLWTPPDCRLRRMKQRS